MSKPNWNLNSGEREADVLKLAQEKLALGKTLDEILDELEEEDDGRDLVETGLSLANPYREMVFGDGEDDDEEYVLLSVTNIRDLWQKKFLVTALIGYLNRVSDEFKWQEGKHTFDDEGNLVSEPNEVDPTDVERATIKRFIDTVFKFNPDKHVGPARDAIREDDERRNGEIPPLPEELVKQIPSKEVFYHFNRYISNYHDEIRAVVGALYCDEPHLEDAVCWVKSSESQEELMEFAKVHVDRLISTFIPVKKRKWALRAPFRRNRENTVHYSKDCAIMSEILERQHNDELMIKDMIKNKAMKSHRKNFKNVPEETKKKIKDYKKIVGEYNKSGQISDKDLKDFNEKRQWLEETAADLACPEDGIRIPVFDFRGKEVRKSNIYTKAEKHEETLARLGEWASRGDTDAAKLKEVMDKGCRDPNEGNVARGKGEDITVKSADGKVKKIKPRKKI